MEKKNEYMTKQRKIIEDVLRDLPDGHFTAADISAALEKRGKKIGTATIYRQLDRMQEAGVINKYTLPGGGSACYQYIECPSNAVHHHLKCVNCGKLLHIECNKIGGLYDHILQEHNFSALGYTNIIFGSCRDCVKKSAVNAAE